MFQLGVLNLLVTHARLDAATVQRVVGAIILAAADLGRSTRYLQVLPNSSRRSGANGKPRSSAARPASGRDPRLPG
jgi:hypothetical protein